MSKKEPVFIMVWDRLPSAPGKKKLLSVTCDGYLLYSHDGKGSDFRGAGTVSWLAFAEAIIRSGNEEVLQAALNEAKKLLEARDQARKGAEK